jgi:hypothetical protein
MDSKCNSRGILGGVFFVVRSPAITRTSSWYKELVSKGKGRHKSWLQQLEPGSSEQEKGLSCCEL